MPTRTSVALVATVLGAVLFSNCRLTETTVKAEGLRDRLEPCRIRGIRGEVLCGAYKVWEDREARAGRRIALNLVVVPAMSGMHTDEAIFFLHGGPGAGATTAAASVTRLLSEARENRDLVFVDQRGTGRSNPLDCPESSLRPEVRAIGLEGFLASPEAIAECFDRLRKKADLRFYATPVAIDDLDEVREALGYAHVNLYGGSYGTRAALVYMRRHPETVRSVILRGVAPTDLRLPLYMPRDAQRSLEKVLEACRQDAACRRAFPDVREDLRRVLEKLPSAFDRPLPAGTRVTRESFATTLRLLLYVSNWAVRIPLIIHHAARDDFRPLFNSRKTLQPFLSIRLSVGMMLSVVCTEDATRIRPRDIEQEQGESFLSDFRTRATLEACRHWPRGDLPGDYFEPIRSEAPVLLLSGDLDPVTPPIWGDRAARSLPNSRHIVLPNMGHSGGNACLTSLMNDFLAAGSAEALDTACVQSIPMPGFVLSP